MAFIAWILAQATPMADQLRASGKIYVLVGGVVLIWAGFVYYVYRIERRIRQLEKPSPPKKDQA